RCTPRKSSPCSLQGAREVSAFNRWRFAAAGPRADRRRPARLARMPRTERYGRGDYVPGVDAEINRADRRRNIIEAVEKRLSGLRDADLPTKTGDAKEPDTSKPIKPRRSYRWQGLHRQ